MEFRVNNGEKHDNGGSLKIIEKLKRLDFKEYT
jgi:hypothetical protein